MRQSEPSLVLEFFCPPSAGNNMERKGNFRIMCKHKQYVCIILLQYYILLDSDAP